MFEGQLVFEPAIGKPTVNTTIPTHSFLNNMHVLDAWRSIIIFQRTIRLQSQRRINMAVYMPAQCCPRVMYIYAISLAQVDRPSVSLVAASDPYKPKIAQILSHPTTVCQRCQLANSH